MLLKKLFYHMASYWQLFVYQTRDSTRPTVLWEVFYPYKILSQPTIKNRFEFLGTKNFSKALAKTVFIVGKTSQKLKKLPLSLTPFLAKHLKKKAFCSLLQLESGLIRIGMYFLIFFYGLKLSPNTLDPLFHLTTGSSETVLSKDFEIVR